MNYIITPLDKHTWRLEDPFRTYLYLLEGTKSAALIDCGNGFSGLRETVVSLTEKPVTVILTHGHFDHTGCAAQFTHSMLHPSDRELLLQGFEPQSREENVSYFDKLYQTKLSAKEKEALLTVKPPENTGALTDGQMIELGGRTLEVITTPGHTTGSVCLLDSSYRYLFSGDTVCDNEVLVYFDHSATVEDLSESNQKLLSRRNDYTKIWPGHHRCPLDVSIVEDYIEAAYTVLKNPFVGKKTEIPGGCKLLYEYKTIGISYSSEHIRK